MDAHQTLRPGLLLKSEILCTVMPEQVHIHSHSQPHAAMYLYHHLSTVKKQKSKKAKHVFKISYTHCMGRATLVNAHRSHKALTKTYYL